MLKLFGIAFEIDGEDLSLCFQNDLIVFVFGISDLLSRQIPFFYLKIFRVCRVLKQIEILVADHVEAYALGVLDNVCAQRTGKAIHLLAENVLV